MDLFDLGNGTYSLNFNGNVKTGDLKTIAKVAFSAGIDLNEFEIALLEMNKHDHKRANFGFYGHFIFSSDK